MSDVSPPSSPRKPLKKSPSTTSKLLVGSFSTSRVILWCVFAVLIGILVVECQTRFNYNATLAKFTAAFDKQDAEPDSSNSALTESDIDNMIVGRPVVMRGEERTRTDSYTWRFLLKPYTLKVRYGIKPKIGEQEPMEFKTDD